MEELDIPASLLREDLFALFKAQLKKDFESVGVDAGFTDRLPVPLEALKASIMNGLEPLIRSGSSLLQGLLYRIDISEQQLKSYHQAHPELAFEALLAELIIKRILQKVILKRKFS